VSQNQEFRKRESSRIALTLTQVALNDTIMVFAFAPMLGAELPVHGNKPL
jgi:hypothetical protein